MLHAKSIIAHIVATDPRLRFAAAGVAAFGGCLPAAERPRLRAKATEYHQLAAIADSNELRRRYRHLAHSYECLASDEG